MNAHNAGIAQLVERYLAKVNVAGPNPVSRSNQCKSKKSRLMSAQEFLLLHF